jgi:hypothetical protein
MHNGTHLETIGSLMKTLSKAVITMTALCCALPATAQTRYVARQKLGSDPSTSAGQSTAPKDMSTPDQVAWFDRTMTTAISTQKAGGGSAPSYSPDFRQMSWVRGVASVNYWHDNANGDWVYGPYVAVYLVDARVDEICGLFSKYRRRCTNYGPDGWYVVFDV